MNINELDIINLPYPMFPVTEEEKEILRKAEISYFEQAAGCTTLRGAVRSLRLDFNIESNLTNKITRSLNGQMYLTGALGFKDAELLYSIPWEIRQLLRRVWITKLINQDVNA